MHTKIAIVVQTTLSARTHDAACRLSDVAPHTLGLSSLNCNPPAHPPARTTDVCTLRCEAQLQALPASPRTCTRPLPVAASVAALTARALRNTAAVTEERSWLAIRDWR